MAPTELAVRIARWQLRDQRGCSTTISTVR
jgi:hypothetical protein